MTETTKDPYAGVLERDLLNLLKQIWDAPTMEAGYAILADWGWQCGHGKPAALSTPSPVDGGADVTETAKRIAWETRNLLSTQYRDRDMADADTLWSALIKSDRRAYLAAARAVHPVADGGADVVRALEVLDDLIETANDAMRSANNDGGEYDRATEVRNATEALTTIRAALAALPRSAGAAGLPIKTAPKDGRKLLLWGERAGTDYQDREWIISRWVESDLGAHHWNAVINPTRWAPLPAPPSSEEASNG